MTCYSFESRDPILVQDYRFLFFAKNMSKNIGKDRSKNVRGKHNHKLLDHGK